MSSPCLQVFTRRCLIKNTTKEHIWSTRVKTESADTTTTVEAARSDLERQGTAHEKVTLQCQPCATHEKWITCHGKLQTQKVIMQEIQGSIKYQTWFKAGTQMLSNYPREPGVKALSLWHQSTHGALRGSIKHRSWHSSCLQGIQSEIGRTKVKWGCRAWQGSTEDWVEEG